jgi:hypothetical protein
LEKVSKSEKPTGYPNIFHGHGKREKSLHRENIKRRDESAENQVRFHWMSHNTRFQALPPLLQVKIALSSIVHS